MTVPSFSFGMASGPLSALASAVTTLGKALPIGRDLELDPETGDLKLTSGDLTLVKDGAAIRQEAEIRMRFFLREWFLDGTEGLPYFQNILVKAPNLNVIRGLFIDEILKTAGVKNVLSLDLTHDVSARSLAVSWSAETDLGELINSVVDFEQ